MKTVKIHLKEKIIPFSAYSLPRSQMPQIKNIEHFVNYAEHLGIEVETIISTVQNYNPTQFEYDKWKVNNIKMDWRKDPESISSTKPILVSNDNFVLDGHHRYFAAAQTDVSIPVVKLYLPINKLLKLALEYKELHG